MFESIVWGFVVGQRSWSIVRTQNGLNHRLGVLQLSAQAVNHFLLPEQCVIEVIYRFLQMRHDEFQFLDSCLDGLLGLRHVELLAQDEAFE